MAPSRQGSSLLAACGLTAGCTLAGVGFVPAGTRTGGQPAIANQQPAETAALGAGGRAAAAGGPAAVAAVGLGLAAMATATGRRASATSARAAASAAAEEAPKAPPPPPPFDPAKQPGVTLPLQYFDPAGFCKVGDEDGFRNLRSAELKHGRVAMMAALGAVMQHWLKFPGFEQVPSGIGAVTTPPGTYGLVVLVAAAGAMETFVWTQDPSKEPGNFGDPAGIGQYYDEWRNRELNNGRMAMFAIMGILLAEIVSGKDGVDQILSTTAGNLPVE